MLVAFSVTPLTYVGGPAACSWSRPGGGMR
jgi:hypothetical protein